MANDSPDKSLDLKIKDIVRQVVEKEVAKEIDRIEKCRKKIYKAYLIAGAISLACVGVYSVHQIRSVVTSLLHQSASSELAKVFQQGQNNANKLESQSRIAKEQINEMSKNLARVENDLKQTHQLSIDVTSQVKQSSGLIKNATNSIKEAQELQSELNSELKNAKETVEGLKQNLAATEKYVIQISYLQHMGRNFFPSPYDQEIVDALNKMIANTIPDIKEREQFVQQLNTIVAEKQANTKK